MQREHPRPQDPTVQRRRHRFLSAACILGSLFATLAAFLLLRHQVSAADAERQRAAADQVQAALQRRLDLTSSIVQDLEVFYQASEFVTRAEFAAFTRPLLARNPQVRALEWVPRVPGAELAEHVAAMRADHAPDYRVRERSAGGVLVPVSPRPEHFPVAYLAPRETNEEAFGFDLASSEERMRFVRLAVASGTPVATEGIELVQADSRGLGVLLIVPHWQGIELQGLILGAFDAEDILAPAARVAARDHERVLIFEEGDGGLALLASAAPDLSDDEAARTWREELLADGRLREREVTVGGRTLLLAIESPPVNWFTASRMAPTLSLLAGFALTAIIAAYFGRLGQHAAILSFLVRQDPLTGVLNRRGLEEEMERLRRQPPMAVVLVNIDEFSELNRRFGHGVGDIVLEEIGQRISEACPASAAVGRLDGDEFLVLDGPSDSASTHGLAEKIRRRIAVDPVLAVPSAVHLTASLGLSLRGPESSSLLQAVAEARTGLKAAKREGGNRTVFAPGLEDAEGAVGPAADFLREVCCESKLTVVWEPLVRLSDETVIGHELLIRGPEGELEAPSDLFRAATEQGLLTQLDIRCLRACVAAAGRSDATGHLHFNLLPSTLLDVPATQVLRELESLPTRFRPCIEVNEQQFLGHPKYLLEPVDALRSAGLRIAIDDVGSGRGTLDTVFLLQPDIVKIDLSLVRGAAASEERRDRLARLVKLCRGLTISMVAEGVESAADRDLVRGLGIETGQGFLWPARRAASTRAG
jgi:diguanylate cyclase (GGDEF)-like protein